MRLGSNQHTNLSEVLELNYAEGYNSDHLLKSNYFYEDYKIVLIDGDTQLINIRNDSY